MKIGVISDTHGVLPEGVLDLFQGADAILHAGDIGPLEIVKELEAAAPVRAVCGNMDYGKVARLYPRTDMFELGGLYFYLMHEPYLLDIDPRAAGVSCVVFGHTHIPTAEEKDGVLFFNPGSASRPKWGRAPTVGMLEIEGGRLKAEIIEL